VRALTAELSGAAATGNGASCHYYDLASSALEFSKNLIREDIVDDFLMALVASV
jgi:hypothetical protein